MFHGAALFCIYPTFSRFLTVCAVSVMNQGIRKQFFTPKQRQEAADPMLSRYFCRPEDSLMCPRLMAFDSTWILRGYKTIIGSPKMIT